MFYANIQLQTLTSSNTTHHYITLDNSKLQIISDSTDFSIEKNGIVMLCNVMLCEAMQCHIMLAIVGKC